jgi:hypothetical protein
LWYYIGVANKVATGLNFHACKRPGGLIANSANVKNIIYSRYSPIRVIRDLFFTWAKRRCLMNYDQDKVDEMMLALLYLTSSTDKHGTRAWKGLDVSILERLHQKGYIAALDRKSPTLSLTETGAARSKQLFLEHFGLNE